MSVQIKTDRVHTTWKLQIQVKNKLGLILNFSGAKILRPTITNPLEFTWLTAKTSNKQCSRKSVCLSEMLWVELIMFFQSEPNMIQSKNKNRQIRNIFWS